MFRFLCASGSRRVFASACWLALTAPGAYASSITTDGLLLVDGKRMYPIGLLELGTDTYPDWDQRIQDSGANLVWDVEIAYADTTPTCAQVLTAARDGGYYLMIGAGDTWNWDNLATPELEVDQRMYEPGELADLLSCDAAGQNRVVVWANRDEPVWTAARNQIGDIDEAHIRDTYDQLHASIGSPVVAMNFAPVHVSKDIDQWKADVASYVSATDIVMFAAYPYPPGPGTCGEFNVLGYPDCPLDRLIVGEDIFLSELNGPGQPLWMIIQAFKKIPLKEARWEAYASIVHGATGILWAGWNWTHSLGTGEETWPVTRQVISEVSGLHEFLVGRDLPGATTNQPDVEVRALESGEHAIVIAISRNGYDGPATIQLPGLHRDRVQVLNEARHLEAVSGAVTDTFNGYEAHVYRYGLLHSEPFPRPPDESPASSTAGNGLTVEVFPNPSNRQTTVRFQLSEAATTLFTVHDAAGRRVAVIGRGTYAAGSIELRWNGRDLSGRPVAAGTYFVHGQITGGTTGTARILIVK